MRGGTTVTAIAVGILTGALLVTAAWLIFRAGVRRGFALGMFAAQQAIDALLPQNSQHHNDLHEEIDILRMALAEANRRLADTGVTISVEEMADFIDIAEREERGDA